MDRKSIYSRVGQKDALTLKEFMDKVSDFVNTENII